MVGGVSGDPIPVGAVVVTEQDWELRFPLQRDGVVLWGSGGQQLSLFEARDGRQLGPVTLWLP